MSAEPSDYRQALLDLLTFGQHLIGCPAPINGSPCNCGFSKRYEEAYHIIHGKTL
jgi:hypothetical protein